MESVIIERGNLESGHYITISSGADRVSAEVETAVRRCSAHYATRRERDNVLTLINAEYRPDPDQWLRRLLRGLSGVAFVEFVLIGGAVVYENESGEV